MRGIWGQLIEGGKHRLLCIKNTAERWFNQLDVVHGPVPISGPNQALACQLAKQVS